MDSLMRDKYLALALLAFLIVCYMVLLTLRIPDGRGFLESIILLVAGSFVTLLKQSSPPTIDAKPTHGDTNIINKTDSAQVESSQKG